MAPAAFTTPEQKFALHKQCLAYGLPPIVLFWLFLHFTEQERLEYEKTGKINGVQVGPVPGEGRGREGNSGIRERREAKKNDRAEDSGMNKEQGGNHAEKELEKRIKRLEDIITQSAKR